MKFTEDHEWLRIEGDLVVVGITEHASTQLGDVVFVELPEVGTMVAAGDEIVVIESVKAASDIAAPCWTSSWTRMNTRIWWTDPQDQPGGPAMRGAACTSATDL